ncbi:MAG: SDR family NAD(P)-dependent oxidoreductase [Gammaproteobacteria bacterium]|nr:SDR family NAD(P)-dependent oxidoreductase [Gammaproteobacteria bacterium]
MAYSAGKTAVITGAGSGIGRALAQQLNREGCALFLSDINAQSLQATVDAFERPEITTQQTVLDVADKAAVYAWASEVEDRTGHVDIVINNAGVALLELVEDCNYDNIEWLMGINYWGVVYGTQAFLPLLRRSEQGHLVNISSIFGVIAVPTQSAYNSAKFAVRGYTEALRQEMAGTNVHVCCVHPGGIRTNIAKAARGGDPAQSADERGKQFEQMARTTPESAAQQIIRAVEKRKKRLLIGKDAKLIDIIQRLFPVSYPRFMLALARPENLGKTP